MVATHNGGNTNGGGINGGPGYVQPGPNGGSNTSPGQPSSPTDGRPRQEPVMTDPSEDALSTFALDIDTGSYTRFRDAVNQGSSIAPSEVRTEEFVNYFEQGYRAPREGLDVSIDAAALPFREGHRLVRVGISSANADAESRSDADLVLVVDCSGSMGEAGKMETTKTALHTLAASLRSDGPGGHGVLFDRGRGGPRAHRGLPPSGHRQGHRLAAPAGLHQRRGRAVARLRPGPVNGQRGQDVARHPGQ